MKSRWSPAIRITASAWPSPAQPDYIADLSSKELLDLSAIDAKTGSDGDQAFHIVAGLEGHAGEAALVYDKAAGHTELQLDVDGDAVADMVIWLAGNRTAFTGFVL